MIADRSADAPGIVIIGRNEGERLRRCFASVHDAVGKTAYVDSGSTDGSPALAKELGIAVVNLDLTKPFTAARARNEGFNALKERWPDVAFVQFIDGDCELDAHWLAAALPFLATRPDVAVVCGRLRERHPEVSVYNKLCDIEWDTPIGQTTACGGIALMRVSAFDQAGGFRAELIGGEEPELCLRLREKGWTIWRLDCDMALHDAAMTRLRQWWIRAVRGGYGLSELSRLHKDSPLNSWNKGIRSSVLWGCLLPLVIASASLVQPIAAFAFLIYPIQIARIAARRGITSIDSWIYGTFIVLAMFAQFQGILKFHWHRWRGRASGLIEYKRAA